MVVHSELKELSLKSVLSFAASIIIVFFLGLFSSLASASTPRVIKTGCGGILQYLTDYQEKFDYYKLGPGRGVAYRFVKGDPDKPTLVLLPGLIRSFSDVFPAYKLLKREGYNLLVMTTSLHWQSFKSLEKNEVPYFEKDGMVTLDSLAKEVRVLLDFLKIKKPIVVGLSYSTSIASKLNLPTIHTSPMTKPSDLAPMLAQYGASAELASGMEKFIAVGPMKDFWLRQYRDFNYRNFWYTIANTSQFFLPEYYGGQPVSRVVNGFSALSRSAEGFDLLNADFKNSSRKFIIGGNEDPETLKNQMRVFQKAAKAGPAQIIIVLEAGHFLFLDQPEGYTAAINALVHSRPRESRVGVVNPSSDFKDVVWLDKKTAAKVISDILNQ